MASRDLDDLNADFKLQVAKWLSDCEDAGLDILVTCTYRSAAEQDALYAQGREPLDEVNALRKAVGLLPISGLMNNVVTNCKGGESEHQKREAVDFVPLNAGKCDWNNPLAFLKAGELAEARGLTWAGRFTSFKETCHIQAHP